MNSKVSLADVVEFESLTARQQEIARKVLLDSMQVDDKLLREAYRAGYEDALNDLVFNIPRYSDSYATEWIKANT